MSNTKARVRLKIQFGAASLGPGKVALLESVAQTGSISAAARAMGMGYRRAWHLLHSLEESLDGPLLTTETGGKAKGGATLTPLADGVIRLYREAEAKSAKGAGALMRLLNQRAKP